MGVKLGNPQTLIMSIISYPSLIYHDPLTEMSIVSRQRKVEIIREMLVNYYLFLKSVITSSFYVYIISYMASLGCSQSSLTLKYLVDEENKVIGLYHGTLSKD